MFESEEKFGVGHRPEKLCESQYVTKREIMSIFSVSSRTVSQWMAKHGLPYINLKSVVRYDIFAVRAWFDGHQKGGGRDAD